MAPDFVKEKGACILGERDATEQGWTKVNFLAPVLWSPLGTNPFLLDAKEKAFRLSWEVCFFLTWEGKDPKGPTTSTF